MKKVTTGEGLKKTESVVSVRYLVAGLATITLSFTGATLILILLPLLIAWILPKMKPSDLQDVLRFYLGRKTKLQEEIESMSQQLKSAETKILRQVNQIMTSDLTPEEEAVLFQIALFAPIKGKQATKKAMPEVLKRTNLANLEFISELATDLKVRV